MTAIPNSQMRAGRFLRWQTARRKAAWIQQQIREGRTVCLVTYTKATKITAKQLPQVRAERGGLFVLHGKSWINYDGAALRAGG